MRPLQWPWGGGGEGPSASVGEGVPAQGMSSRGRARCLPSGGCLSRGWLPRGSLPQGKYLPGGGCLGRQPPYPVNRITDRCKNITFPQSTVADDTYRRHSHTHTPRVSTGLKKFYRIQWRILPVISQIWLHDT